MDAGLKNFSNQVGSFTRARSIDEENQRLRAQIESAKLYDARVEALANDLEATRSLSELPDEPGRTKIPARIIQFLPYEARITISAGGQSGIKIGDPVVNSRGILAVITNVSSKTAQANLLSSGQTTIGAMVINTPPSVGLLKGNGSATLLLDYLDIDAPTKVGDIVATSGYSETIPRGLIIGRVIKVTSDSDYGRQTVQVAPAARVGDTDEVVVYR